MKILHINSYFNGSLFYKNLYDKQMEDGLDIDVFVPVAAPFKGNKGIYGNYTTLSTNHSKYDRLFFHLKHYKIYKDIIRKYNVKEYSLTHAHSLFSNGYIAMKLKRDYQLPYIVAIRNTDVNLFFEKMPYLRVLGVNILNQANTIIFLSKSYRDLVIEKYVPRDLKQDFYKKSVVIPNGIDDFWFRNIGEGKKLNKVDTLNLLYIGAVNKNKNLTTTVKAIKILKKKGYNIEFTVVGSIQDKKIYEEHLKNNSWIKYITSITKEELINIYRKNDIFVMPSIKETFGLVYAEAMSQGLPIIYTKDQGFDKQFEEGTVGYSVNPLDSNDIAKRIIDVTYKYEALSSNCINKVSKFNWESIQELYLMNYSKVIQEKDSIHEKI